ncbi:hypothetical protein ACP70R_033328 [Stipagrostis hirtigluma subsp. patula]
MAHADAGAEAADNGMGEKAGDGGMGEEADDGGMGEEAAERWRTVAADDGMEEELSFFWASVRMGPVGRLTMGWGRSRSPERLCGCGAGGKVVEKREG